ncbi:MAG TPA: glycosyltransferase family 39 protein [Pseudonocardiaceae bacterium]
MAETSATTETTATTSRAGTRPAAAWPMIAVIAGVLASVHVAFSGGYGYHRDELYFVRAGRELDWGYPDQPPLTPLLARLVTELFGDSLVALRLLSALSVGVVVVLTALLAREFGGGRGPQLLAGAAMAVSTYLTAVGHLMSTATFDLLAWTALSWLIVRALRTGGPSWLAVGVVAAIGLQNKVLVGFLLGGLLVGLLLVGPRAALRSPWPWLAGVIALLAWAPFLVWQTAHGWPQLDVATSIAAGSSGTSEPWYLFIPFQLVLISPVLVPVWVAGLVRLLRDPQLRLYRAFAVAYAALAILFLLTGGKPYYLCGLYPVLLAAGAEPALRWVGRGATRLRSALLAAALVTSAAVSAVLFLPIVPVESLAATPIVDINHDAGETVGWRPFAETIGQAVARPAERRAGHRRGAHRQLRRGWRHRPLPRRARLAAGLQRAQRLRPVGPAAGDGRSDDRRRLPSRAAATMVRIGRTGRPDRQRRRAGQ